MCRSDYSTWSVGFRVGSGLSEDATARLPQRARLRADPISRAWFSPVTDVYGKSVLGSGRNYCADSGSLQPSGFRLGKRALRNRGMPGRRLLVTNLVVCRSCSGSDTSPRCGDTMVVNAVTSVHSRQAYGLRTDSGQAYGLNKVERHEGGLAREGLSGQRAARLSFRIGKNIP